MGVRTAVYGGGVAKQSGHDIGKVVYNGAGQNEDQRAEPFRTADLSWSAGVKVDSIYGAGARRCVSSLES